MSMIPYAHKKLSLWRLISMALRGLSRLLALWPLLVIAVVILSPVGPHLRWQYTYEQHATHRHYLACWYLGSRGFVRTVQPDFQCPILIILDRRKI